MNSDDDVIVPDEDVEETVKDKDLDDPIVAEEVAAEADSEFSEPKAFRDKKHSDPGWFDPATIEAEAIEKGAEKGIGDDDDDDSATGGLGMHVEEFGAAVDDPGLSDDVESLDALREKEDEDEDEKEPEVY